MKTKFLDVKVNLEEADSNLSELYHSIRDITSDFRNANLYRLVISCLTGNTLLDVGAGVGHFVSIAQENGYCAMGVEPSQKLMSLGKDLYSNIDITCSKAEDFVTDKQYDNITTLDVVEHIEDDENLLNHFKSFLKPDGKLIIIVPAHQFLYGLRDVSVGHYRRYSRKQLSDLVQKCDLRISMIRHWNAIGFLPYLFSEKILNMPLNLKIRNSGEQKGFKRIISKALYAWIRYFENNFDFRFGLSLICVAENK